MESWTGEKPGELTQCPDECKDRPQPAAVQLDFSGTSTPLTTSWSLSGSAVISSIPRSYWIWILFMALMTLPLLVNCKLDSQETRVKRNLVASDNASVVYLYVVGVANKFDPFCSGVIINETWVATAAHCLDEISPSVTIGLMAGRPDPKKEASGEQRRSVSSVTKHPKYNEKTLVFDFALIEVRLCQFWMFKKTYEYR
ncbi:hypothetical protein L596_006640 [Steinernema carpocapsae]|uniref:Peptidase S1 domain-containing protein n=1 Tax=Steinernema carpocapsae TaxID=34508 RepID=A0A4U8V317_STECR|nr:hypothetical protein L596_006640 [Steinernema carpocapsae]